MIGGIVGALIGLAVSIALPNESVIRRIVVGSLLTVAVIVAARFV